MAKKLFVGGLSWNTTSDQLKAAFAEHGTVADAMVITDRETGRSRGFGFVSFASDTEADKAVAAMNGALIDGRPIKVDPATDRPRTGPGAGPPGGGFRGPPSGGGGGGGGGFRGPPGGAPREGGAPPAGRGGREFGPPKAPGGSYIGERPRRPAPDRTERPDLDKGGRGGGGKRQRDVNDTDDEE